MSICYKHGCKEVETMTGKRYCPKCEGAKMAKAVLAKLKLNLEGKDATH